MNILLTVGTSHDVHSFPIRSIIVVSSVVVLAIAAWRCQKECTTCNPKIRKAVIEAHILMVIQSLMLIFTMLSIGFKILSI
jgi:uncharacterized membrane protein YidH (DUF202 family)